MTGSLYAYYTIYVCPYDFTLAEMIFVLSLVVVGGSANLWGPLVGAPILVLMPELFRFLPIPNSIAGGLRQILTGLLLIFLMRFRPEGILSEFTGVGAQTRTKAAPIIMPEEPLLFEAKPRNRVVKLPLTTIEESKDRQEGYILELENLSKSFGGIHAVNDLSFSLKKGKITSLIGPNGAGKTTLFNMISGFIKPDSGRIIYEGLDISSLAPDKIARLGIGRCYQDLRLFPRMTVIDTVMVAFQKQRGENILQAVFNPFLVRKEEKANYDKALAYLQAVGLFDKAQYRKENLSFPEQKLLSLARALATEAELVLLDEPTSGVDPRSIEPMLEIIRRLTGYGKTVCIVEHNMDVVRNISDWIIFMAEGQAVATGMPDTIMADGALAKIYFGS